MTSTVQTSSPLLGGDEFSSWEEDPLFHVTRLCLAFLQGLFSFAPKGSWKWDADDELTDIIITDDAPIDAETVNKRPAVVAVLGPVAWAGIALDQLSHYNFKTGERSHTDMISGHMTFNCLTRKKISARKLAWVVGRHCWILRRMMLKSGFHDFGQRNQIGSASPPGAIIGGAADPEITNVPVTVPFHFQYEDTIGERDLSLVSEIETRFTTMGPQVIRPTQVALPGGPGPGLAGTAVGARASGISSGKLRDPSIAGRPVTEYTTDELPDSQQPGESPLTLKVIT